MAKCLSSGVGQTSRVEAVKQAIEKAKSFGLKLKMAVMASDAVFPFPGLRRDCSQRGDPCRDATWGSIKDQDSIQLLVTTDMAMGLHRIRAFAHMIAKASRTAYFNLARQEDGAAGRYHVV